MPERVCPHTLSGLYKTRSRPADDGSSGSPNMSMCSITDIRRASAHANTPVAVSHRQAYVNRS